MCLSYLIVYVQDLAARNVVVDENLVCKISAIDRCEDLNRSEPPSRVHYLLSFSTYFWF